MILNFDKYSLIIDDKRILVRSASFHYFRSPGIKAWKDRLDKIKSCGYNTIDLYFCWGYHSKQPGVYDFTGIKDIRALLDITVELGLYVIARPGPYINAELSAGGLPKWLFNVPDIVIRNRKDGDFVYSASYMQAVKEWYSRIIPILEEYQNIIAFQIENEYSTNEAEPDYIQELYNIARDIGMKIPIFHNDAFCAGLYSNIVNIYAIDSYPVINLNYDWRKNPYTFGGLDYIEENIREYSPDSPLFIAELQSGWFDKRGGAGYEYIRKLFGKEHINIVTKTALSQGVTMFNHYMGCGGTSWGQLACNEVYTSYDFAAPISEYGMPQENYYKVKEINYFLQAFNLSETYLIADQNTLLDKEDELLFAKLRQDNLNNCKWLFVRNLDESRENFKVQDSFNVSLKSFDMKILPIDLNLYGCKIDFSSLSIFSRIDKKDHEIIFLLLDENTELLISDFESCQIPKEIKADELLNTLKISFINLPEQDLFSCKFSKNGKITEFIFLKEETAEKTWIINNKAVIGPDFISNNLAAFNDKNNKTVVLVLNTDFTWQSINIENFRDLNIDEKLADWKIFKCAPEIDKDYDYFGWNLIESSMDCISNRVYDEFIWYKSSFSGTINQIKLSAKHCLAVYLNGIQIFWHDFLNYSNEDILDEIMTVNIDKNSLNQDNNNEITILVQNLGFDKGFENPPELPRGILNFETIPYKKIEWRIRGGLIPKIEEWDFVPVYNLENSSNNSCLIWACTEFEINIPDNIACPLYIDFDSAEFDKANIYLNGNLIGHYWKSKDPQSKFYLMDEFLKQKNLLSLIIWNRNDDYNFSKFNVNISIRNYDSYNLVDIKKFV